MLMLTLTLTLNAPYRWVVTRENPCFHILPLYPFFPLALLYLMSCLSLSILVSTSLLLPPSSLLSPLSLLVEWLNELFRAGSGLAGGPVCGLGVCGPRAGLILIFSVSATWPWAWFLLGVAMQIIGHGRSANGACSYLVARRSPAAAWSA